MENIPQFENLEKTEPQFQDINSLNFSEIQAEENEICDVVHVSKYLNKDEREEHICNKLKNKYWWFADKWIEKGLPKEQIKVKLDEIEIEIFNWYEDLSEKQIEEITNMLKLFYKNCGEELKNTKYILINNQSGGKHEIIGDEMNGRSPQEDYIELYPNALKDIDHRVDKVSNLEGTIIHELSHKISLEIINSWKIKFGKECDNLKAKGGANLHWQSNEPSSCVTDLARSHYSEDLCESMVAALKNPAILDQEKMKFLIDNNLIEADNQKDVTALIDKLSGSKMEMPIIELEIKFKTYEDDLEIYV